MSWIGRILVWLGHRPATVPPPTGLVAPFDERELIRRHNEERRHVDLMPLLRNPVLSSLALARAARAASLGLPRERLHDGFELVPGSTTSGENAEVGAADAREVMAGWMTSDRHRGNILNPDFATMGAGRAISKDGVPFWYCVFAGLK